MSRARILALLVVAVVLSANGGPIALSDAERLQGTWTIVSVHRDGEIDPAQVGAPMTFAGNAVLVEPLSVPSKPEEFLSVG